MSEDLGMLILDFGLAGEEVVPMDAAENSRKKTQNLYEPKVIAQLFNFDWPRRIEQLTLDGVIDAVLVKVDGHEVRRYDLAPTIQKYVKFLSDKAYGRSRSQKETELKEQKLEAEIALKESQGELHRLKTQIAAGEYISVDEVLSLIHI